MKILKPKVILKAPQSGANANNNMYRVRINPELTYFRAILAQEVFEFHHKWAYLRGFIMPFSYSMQIKMEILGHAVELAWAVMHNSADYNTYLSQEARALERYKSFRSRNLNRQTIKSMMADQYTIAIKWVLENKTYIEQLDRR